MDYPGRVLKRGSRGQGVSALQDKLGIKPTGVFGAFTEECVVAFQRAQGLQTDGEVGPLTWAALFTVQQPAELGPAALEIAKAQIGVKEDPLGSNRGPKVDAYLARIGLDPGQPWCIAFIYSCVDDAAQQQKMTDPLPKTGSTSALFRWAQAKGRLVARPEPGDIFLCIGGETGHYHGGFVAGPIRDDRFPTIEGNSNDDGSPNGVEVVRRPRGRRLAACHYVRI